MPQLTQKQKKEYTEIFHKYDTDGNGQIVGGEMRAMCKDLGFEMSNDDIKCIMKDVDKNNDGKMSLEEFLLVMSRLPSIEREKAGWRAAFGKFDLDSNGTITRNEMVKVCKAMGIDEAQADSMIQSVDKNDDGMISFIEFIAAMRPDEKVEESS